MEETLSSEERKLFRENGDLMLRLDKWGNRRYPYRKFWFWVTLIYKEGGFHYGSKKD